MSWDLGLKRTPGLHTLRRGPAWGKSSESPQFGPLDRTGSGQGPSDPFLCVLQFLEHVGAPQGLRWPREVREPRGSASVSPFTNSGVLDQSRAHLVAYRLYPLLSCFIGVTQCLQTVKVKHLKVKRFHTKILIFSFSEDQKAQCPGLFLRQCLQACARSLLPCGFLAPLTPLWPCLLRLRRERLWEEDGLSWVAARSQAVSLTHTYTQMCPCEHTCAHMYSCIRLHSTDLPRLPGMNLRPSEGFPSPFPLGSQDPSEGSQGLDTLGERAELAPGLSAQERHPCSLLKGTRGCSALRPEQDPPGLCRRWAWELCNHPCGHRPRRGDTGEGEDGELMGWLATPACGEWSATPGPARLAWQFLCKGPWWGPE